MCAVAVRGDPALYEFDGMYSPTEVSSYLLVTLPAQMGPPTSRRIFRWIRAGLVAPGRREQAGRDLVINFDDLVTCQAITILRAAGFSLEGIRRTEAFFSREYRLAKPFADRRFW